MPEWKYTGRGRKYKYKPYNHRSFSNKSDAVKFRKSVRASGQSTHLKKMKTTGKWKVYIYW